MNDFTGFKDVVPLVNRDILNLAREAGFDELVTEDIENVLASHTEELTNEDLTLLAQSPDDADEDDDDDEPKRILTTKRMAAAFRLIEEGLQVFTDDDPNRERSSKIHRNTMEALRCYSDLYKEKKKKATKQSTLESFFRQARPEAAAQKGEEAARDGETTARDEEESAVAQPSDQEDLPSLGDGGPSQ